MSSLPIVTPANFAAASAMGYSDSTGGLSLVSANSPLPVTMTGVTPATPSAVTGTTATSGTFASFSPARGIAIVLVLSGTWQGSVRVVRSTDGGVTFNPLTVGGTPWAQYTGNVCEAVWEDNDPAATIHLVVALSAGSLSYRLGH